MLKPNSGLFSSNLAPCLEKLRLDQINAVDWQTEKLNFIPLRGSWFANSEADFDLEKEINKFLAQQNNKKVMLLMGDSGAGKSLYTQGFVNKLWQNFSAQSPIPIWISLPSIKHPQKKIVQKALKKYGFDSKQIKELCRTRSFIFILDAYDEIHCEKNLYQTNHLNKWNAKIIITCRREYLYHKDNYKLFFAPFIGDKIQYSQYEEIYIKPFNTNQIQTYIQQYLKTQAVNWKEPEKYIKAIEEITGLKELIKTPFILRLTMEVLPQIVEKYVAANQIERKKVTQAALYDVFIEEWFIRQEKKLKEAKKIKENEDIKPEFWSYAKALASEMHKANCTYVNYEANEESDLFDTETPEDLWSKFFVSKNSRIELLRTACLIREASPNHYAFIHSSLLEYFLTRNLYETLKIECGELITSISQDAHETNTSQVQQRIPAALSSTTNMQNNQGHQNSIQDYFNQRLIVKEDNTLQFLADRVSEQESFKRSLFDRVNLSRNNPKNKIAAANAITILNRAGVVFSGMDLSGIQIPEADLSYGVFHYSNFFDADLQNVNLKQAYLQFANLSNCVMSGVDFGQTPFLLDDEKYKNVGGILCYSHNGNYLAMRMAGGNILIWDMIANTQYALLEGHTDGISSINFSPDDTKLVTGSGGSTVRLWDITKCKLSKIIRHENIGKDYTVKAAFSPDGKMLAMVSFYSIYTYRIDDKQGMKRLSADYIKYPDSGLDEPWFIIFSPDGKILVTRYKYDIILWNTEHENWVYQKLSGHTGAVRRCAFSPDSKLMATGSFDKSILLWDMSNKTLIGKPIIGHTSEISCLAFSPDGKILASGSSDHSIRFWEVASHALFGSPIILHDPIEDIAFDPSGAFLVSSDKTAVRTWDVKNQISQRKMNIENNHKDRVDGVIFSPDSKWILSCSADKTLRLWNTLDSQESVALEGREDHFWSAIFSQDGRYIAAKDFEKMQVWDTVSRKYYGEPFKARLNINDPVSMYFCKDPWILMTVKNNYFSFWDILSRKEIGQPTQWNTNNLASVIDVAFSEDSSRFVIIYLIQTKHIKVKNNKTKEYYTSGDNRIIQFFDAKSRKPVGEPIDSIAGSYNKIVFNPDCTLLVCQGNERFELFDIKNRKFQPFILNNVDMKVSTIAALAFTPDSKQLVSGSYDGVRLWSVSSGECLKLIYASSSVIWDLKFSHDGKTLLLATGNAILQLKRQQLDQDFYIVWSSSIFSLEVKALNIKNVKGLSASNLKLLKQLGAYGDTIPTEKSEAFYSTASSSSPTIFKPAAESQHDKSKMKDNSQQRDEDKKDTEQSLDSGSVTLSFSTM